MLWLLLDLTKCCRLSEVLCIKLNDHDVSILPGLAYGYQLDDIWELLQKLLFKTLDFREEEMTDILSSEKLLEQIRSKVSWVLGKH